MIFAFALCLVRFSRKIVHTEKRDAQQNVLMCTVLYVMTEMFFYAGLFNQAAAGAA